MKFESNLKWPESWPRTSKPSHSRFQTGNDFADNRDALSEELRLLRATDGVLTADLSGRDQGVAVWFKLNSAQRVIACDRWLTTGENLRAIVLTISAMRDLSRWGAGDVVERAFNGFALTVTNQGITGNSSPKPNTSNWRKILRAETATDIATVKAAYHKLMRAVHTDSGGSNEIAIRLNAAMAEAERELAS